MRATGIVRRIDDLGRVVIPKEIRKNMNIKEGDPLEIFISKDGVIFQKYRPAYYTDVNFIADIFVDSNMFDTSEQKQKKIEIAKKLHEIAKEMQKLEED